MLKWIESTGKSEEAAIEAALQKLGMASWGSAAVPPK